MDEMEIFPLVDFSDNPMYGNNIEKLQLFQALERDQKDILLFVFEFVNWGKESMCAVYKSVATSDRMNQYRDLIRKIYSEYYLRKISEFSPSVFIDNMRPVYSSKKGILFIDEEKAERFSLEDFSKEIKYEEHLEKQERLREGFTIRTGETHVGDHDFAIDATRVRLNDEDYTLWRDNHEPLRYVGPLGEPYVPPGNPPGDPYAAQILQEPPQEEADQEAIRQEVARQFEVPRATINNNTDAQDAIIFARNNQLHGNTTTGTTADFDIGRRFDGWNYGLTVGSQFIWHNNSQA